MATAKKQPAKPPAKRGPKPLFTQPQIRDRLLTALRTGAYLDAACGHAGIGLSTLMLWMQRGRDERERINAGIPPNPNEAPFVEIMEAVEKARYDAEVRNIGIIQNAAANGQWQAAAWWLERTMPRKYGRRMEIGGDPSSPINVSVTVEDVEAKIVRLLEIEAE